MKTEIVDVVVQMRLEYDPMRPGARENAIRHAKDLHLDVAGCSVTHGGYVVQSVGKGRELKGVAPLVS